MKASTSKALPYFGLAIGVIFLDQLTKVLVYHFMDMGYSGEIALIGNFIKLHYTLNPGMAMGIELENIINFDFFHVYGKLVLSLFRIVAMVGISYYLYQMILKNAPKGFLICISLILGGAIGNVIDTTFYGVIFNNAPYGVITPWFHGQVIDMIYFDIWEGYIPEKFWFIPVPILGGQYYSFWPIFNVADSSIFVSVFVIMFNQKRFFAEPVENVPADSTEK